MINDSPFKHAGSLPAVQSEDSGVIRGRLLNLCILKGKDIPIAESTLKCLSGELDRRIKKDRPKFIDEIRRDKIRRRAVAKEIMQ